MNEQELIRRADLALTDLVNGGGYLTTEQSNRFFRKMMDDAVILNQARLIPMSRPKMEINKIGFGSRVLRAANQGNLSSPTADGTTCRCRELGHVMQSASTRVRGRRVGLVAADQGRRHYRDLVDRPAPAGLGPIFQPCTCSAASRFFQPITRSPPASTSWPCATWPPVRIAAPPNGCADLRTYVLGSHVSGHGK